MGVYEDCIIWLRIGTGCGMSGMQAWNFGFCKRWGITGFTEGLFDS